MNSQKTNNFPVSGINRYMASYIRNLPDLTSKLVLDIPCGDGRASFEFLKKGAKVIAYDLFPHNMSVEALGAEYADLSETLPLESGSVDYIVCQEGIEHIANQLKLLEEFNRVLKSGGQLLITTPNNSHLRARLTHLFLESDYWKRMPPTEIDAVWFSEKSTDKLYFGHLFLLGVQQLQSLLTFTGFTTKIRLKTDVGTTSFFLSLLLYPFLAFCSTASFLYYKGEHDHVTKELKSQILWNRVKLNLAPKTLLCKHIFWVAEKENSLDEVLIKLKKMQRQKKAI